MDRIKQVNGQWFVLYEPGYSRIDGNTGATIETIPDEWIPCDNERDAHARLAWIRNEERKHAAHQRALGFSHAYGPPESTNDAAW